MGCLNDKEREPPKVAQPAGRKQDEEEKSFKLLLLGAGGSGKSTVFRQVKILYGGGYNNDERKGLAITIHQNIVMSLKKMLGKMKMCNIDFAESQKVLCGEKEELATDLRTRMLDVSDDGPYDKDNAEPSISQLKDLIAALWSTEQVKDMWVQRSRYQLPSDSVDYFFNNIKTIMVKNYFPDETALLHCRIHSTGVKSETFTMRHEASGESKKQTTIDFRLLDVGGQRSERKKWVRCFENVTAVLYVVAISEYDQLCYEDNETNRVSEALDLFEDIANSEWFADIDIILFLNKKDLLVKKFPVVPPRTYFDGYDGNEDVEVFIKYLQNCFDERNQQERGVCCEVTTATSTKMIKKVFEGVIKKILLKKTSMAKLT